MALFGKSPSAAPPTVSQGFDRLRVTEGDRHRWLTRKEFEGLPLVDRVRLLAAGTLEFFRGDERIASREALRT